MKAHRPRRRLKKQGMTLIEIMVVVMIMAMMAAAVGMGVMKAKADADIKLARTEVRSIASAVEAFLLEHPSEGCPDMEKLVTSGTLRKGTHAEDPWGNPYRIVCEAADVQVKSHGKDSEPDSPDDISVF